MGSAPSHKGSTARVPEWARTQDKFNKKTKYPYCRGTFPDCPEEIKPEVVADVCKMCPIYRK
ncbi:TPA: hypothetical protein HA295_00640 [Candidatus Woesearchaeota archaeon]|nr:hypothetical protein [Candidatus Woesearchaeota archaeon]